MRSFHECATVVILTYNRVNEVARTVEQMRRLPERPAIIVVDNGSSDGTSRFLIRRFPDVEVIRCDTNLGTAARNVGIQAARTPYVALCDDDTWWAPGAVQRATDLLAVYPRVALLCGRVLVGPEQREDPVCRVMASSPLPHDQALPGRTIMGFLAGASMVRRSAFLAVGGFEPRFFLGGEEALVAVDLVTAGWVLIYTEDVVIHHAPSPHRDTLARRRLLLRNALWFAWLRRPLPVALRQSWQMARPTLHQPLLLPAWIQALRGLPWVLKQRRILPPRVEATLRLLEQQSRDHGGPSGKSVPGSTAPDVVERNIVRS